MMNITWSTWSPYFSPMDYFLWGYLKHRVYVSKPNSLNELNNKTTTEI